jgi:glycosyltransferase involved in cell wall biosynthesis
MIIGIDASRANREHKSGTEWYSYYVIRWLAKLDQKNQYILYTYEPLKKGLVDLTNEQYIENEADETSIKPTFDKDGFQILKSPFNNFKGKILNWPFNFFWTQGRLSLEMLINRPDVLFVPAHALPIIHPSKSIVTIHDIGFERDRRLYTKDKLGPENQKCQKYLNIFVKLFTFNRYTANSFDYLKWSTKYAIKKAQKIITVSEFTKNELIQHYNAPARKIKVIYNGYNKFIFKPILAKEKIDKILINYDISRPYILCVGRIERKKNIPALIEAFGIVKNRNKSLKHKLILVGDASFGFDETNYMIKEYALDNEVIMTGWVKEEHLPYIYSGADAFIFPSNYEGFGIPLLQAMACEVPKAASDAASIPEVVGEAALFFNPYDVHSIADAIEKIIIDERLRSTLKNNGAEKIKYFSWKKCAAETLKEIDLQ